MAAIGTGSVAPETDWARAASVVEPNPENRAVYDRLFQTYQELYPATRDQMHALAALQSTDQ
jgi:xylulokinase